MALKRIKLPDGTTYDINDARITGIDSTPTANSTNLITSGGVKSALDSKQDSLTIDTTLSGTSPNPVTNSAITSEFTKVTYMGETIESVEEIDDEEPEYDPIIVIGGGDENVIESITFNGNVVPITNKNAAITVTIPTVPVISTSISTDASSNSKTASPKAVKDYVDGIVGNLETLLAAI